MFLSGLGQVCYTEMDAHDFNIIETFLDRSTKCLVIWMKMTLNDGQHHPISR
jgi:hypothetical protein